MFATKILVASALAAGSMAFAAQPAQAAGGGTHISVGFAVAPTYCPPAVTYYRPAPVLTYAPAQTYYAPAPVCEPQYVPAPVYCPAPVVVYDRDRYFHPDFSFRFGFGGSDRHDDHRDGHHNDHHDGRHDGGHR
jgi:hypothetical protein